MKSNCREVPAVIDYCNSMNATINLSFVENPSSVALWTMCSKELKELEIFYNAYTFKSAKGVNSEYNIKAFRQFVKQISDYREVNRAREDEFFQNLKTEDEVRKILTDILSQALQGNIIFESDRKNIIKAVNEVESELSGFQQHIYFGNLANFLEKNGIETIKSLMNAGFDYKSLVTKLNQMSEMPDIYNKSYKDI